MHILFDFLKTQLPRATSEKNKIKLLKKWSGKIRITTGYRLFFVTRIINVFREAKLKIMTKRTYFMSFCYSLISDDFVMEVIAKSGKNAIIESDYIGFLYVTGNIRSAIYYRAETELIRIAKMKSLIS